MFNTFNMGVGMSIVVREEDVCEAINILENCGERPYIIGRIAASDDKIEII